MLPSEVLAWSWVKVNDVVPDVFGGPLAGLRIVVQDDELHLVLQAAGDKRTQW